MIGLRKTVATLAVAAAFGLGAAGPASAGEEQALVDKSRITVEAFTTDKQMVNMRAMLREARGVIVVPQLLKGGFIVGGSGGSGVLMARDRDRNAWSAPSFITMGSGSIGAQFGAEAQQLVLLIMTDKGMNAVLDHKVTLGGEASIAVGPVGAGAEAATTTGLGADIYSFGRSKGLFAGVALEGAVIESRDDYNRNYYGRAVTPKDVLFDWSVVKPDADGLKKALIAAGAAG